MEWLCYDAFQFSDIPNRKRLIQEAITDTIPIYGTSNGYDNGGNAPICWISELPLPVTSNTNITTNSSAYIFEEDIEITTDLMYNEVQVKGSDEKVGTLLPACYEGLSLNVVPLNLPLDRIIEIGKDYTFLISISANFKQITEQLVYQDLNGTVEIFVRLLLCDVMKQGFCNPLRNTNDKEQELSPSDTDIELAHSNNQTDESKYDYDSTTVLKGILDGSVIFTRWIHWTMNDLSASNTSYKSDVNITLRLPEGSRVSNYFFIGHGAVSFDFNTGTVYRVDIAEAIRDNVVEVQKVPEIMLVNKQTKIILGLAIGIFGLIALLMFGFIIYHLDHVVMKLTQGPLLAAMTFACLVQIVFTFAVLPTQDLFCVLVGPMILIPQTFVAAVLVGRVWRVHTTLSAINNFAKAKDEHRFSIAERALVSCLNCLAYPLSKFKSSNTGLIRKKVTATDSATLIVNLTLPQLIIQVTAALYYKPELNFIFNDAGTIGRQVCTKYASWAEAFGISYAALLFIVAICMAWISRGLPSAFNEKNEIFKVSFISAFIEFTQLTLFVFLKDPTSDPNVSVRKTKRNQLKQIVLAVLRCIVAKRLFPFQNQVFLKGLLIIGIAVFILNAMVWPKMKRVMSGEKVVIGKILNARDSVPSFASFSNSVTATTPETRTNYSENGDQSSERVFVCKGEALPPDIEIKIQHLKHILSEVSNEM